MIFSNYIRNTFARGTAMMGGTFIINAIIVSGNFRKILGLMRSGLLKNNLNNFLLETSNVLLLLLAFSIASFFDRFLGTCDHPSFMIQLNIPKTLIVAFGVLGSFQQCINIPFITFFLCFIWCSNFSRLLNVSLGDHLFLQLSSTLLSLIFILQ